MVSATPEQVLDLHADLAGRMAGANAMHAVASFMAYFIEDAWNKDNFRARGMFYPLIPPPRDRRTKRLTVSRETGAKLARIIGEGLQEAVTYEVSEEMVQVMRDVYEKSAAEVEYLHMEELPCRSGFAYLDMPWDISDVHGMRNPVRAVAWDFTTALTNGTEEDYLPEPEELPCVRISLWTSIDDDLAEGNLPERYAEGSRRDLGELTLMHVATIPFGMRFKDPENQRPKSAKSMLSLVHMLWMFLGMEIVTTRKHVPARHFRRRALKVLKNSDVRVILLRRLAHPDTGEDVSYREVEWSCRWVVQGHWRHHEKPEKAHGAAVAYAGMLHSMTDFWDEFDKKASAERHLCGQCEKPVSWVKPYLKGPDGLPLKVSRTLMLLAR